MSKLRCCLFYRMKTRDLSVIRISRKHKLEKRSFSIFLFDCIFRCLSYFLGINVLSHFLVKHGLRRYNDASASARHFDFLCIRTWKTKNDERRLHLCYRQRNASSYALLLRKSKNVKMPRLLNCGTFFDNSMIKMLFFDVSRF